MLIAKIESDLRVAQKAKDWDKISFLRFLLARLHDLAIEKGKDRELLEEEIIAELEKEVRRHRESIEAFKKGGRQDLIEKEEKELSILQTYLPPQLSDNELEKMIDQEIKKVGNDFSKIMKALIPQVRGRADGARIARLVKGRLNES